MLKNNAEQIRMSLRTARKAMTDAQRVEQSQLLCEKLSQWLPGLDGKPTHSRIVAAFWPLADEPDITPVLHALNQVGHIVALPVVATRSAPLEFHRWQPDLPMTQGNFGVMEPARTQPLQPDILLIPTLGFTSQGDRLGYGGGYYDRTLSAMHAQQHTPLTIGIAWSEALLSHRHPDYSPQTHDVPLQAILSAQGWSPAKPDITLG